jgi:hypothetical protein
LFILFSFFCVSVVKNQKLEFPYTNHIGRTYGVPELSDQPPAAPSAGEESFNKAEGAPDVQILRI